MLNEKDLLNIIKKTYPQNPSEDFIATTERKLRQKARSMSRTFGMNRFIALSSGFLLFVLAFSWLFLFSEKEGLSNVLGNPGEESVLPAVVDEKDPLVFIYHSHNRESYKPELDSTHSSEVYSETTNVTLVGEALSKALKEYNINTIHDHTDFSGILQEQYLPFTESYAISRQTILETLSEHKSIEILLDIHRDSLPRVDTTISINGIDYAKIWFAVSTISDNYEVNKAFALSIHEKLETLYPGLSKGIIEKGEQTQNTYNQDILGNSALLNIGGVENTLEESYRTTDALAEAIKEIILESKE